MKFLRDLDINIGEEILMSGISSSSKLIKENECFIALQGISSHGVDYIDEAISNGAACILHNKKNYSLNHQIPCFFVEDLFEKQKQILRRKSKHGGRKSNWTSKIILKSIKHAFT